MKRIHHRMRIDQTTTKLYLPIGPIDGNPIGSGDKGCVENSWSTHIISYLFPSALKLILFLWWLPSPDPHSNVTCEENGRIIESRRNWISYGQFCSLIIFRVQKSNSSCFNHPLYHFIFTSNRPLNLRTKPFSATRGQQTARILPATTTTNEKRRLCEIINFVISMCLVPVRSSSSSIRECDEEM